MSGVSRFDCYPSDFLNGLVGLPGDAIAAYTVLVMLQYDRGGPVLYVGREHEISVRTGLPRGRLAKAVDHLVAVGKLSLVDGRLENSRTSQELRKIGERILKNVENSQEGGEATRRKWEQIRKENNDPPKPPGKPIGKPKQGPISPPSSLPPLENTSSPFRGEAAKEGEGEDSAENWKAFEAGFPWTNLMSRLKPRFVYAALSAADQLAANAALPPWCLSAKDAKTTNPTSAVAFLEGRLFDNFRPKLGAPANRSFEVERDSPAGDLWEAHGRATRGKGYPWVNGRWSFPSALPPPASVPGHERALGAA